uniref:Putative secreted protein n=1 Tax=Anopheles darlingi TaxID=43151 RepID=A0A2M4D4Q3_ANODA
MPGAMLLLEGIVVIIVETTEAAALPASRMSIAMTKLNHKFYISSTSFLWCTDDDDHDDHDDDKDDDSVQRVEERQQKERR